MYNQVYKLTKHLNLETMSNKKSVLISTISYNNMHNTHYVVIKDGLNEYAISRTAKQLQGDLDSINLPVEMAHAVKNCKAEVDLEYHKAGDQIFNFEGNEVEDDKGVKQKYRKDGARINGFVIIEPGEALLIAQLTVASRASAPVTSNGEEDSAFSPEPEIVEKKAA